MELKWWRRFEYRHGAKPENYTTEGPVVITVATGAVEHVGSPEAAEARADALNKANPAKDDRPYISLELKRLKRQEAKEFRAKFGPYQRALMEAASPEAGTAAASVVKQFESMEAVAALAKDEDLALIFDKYVRKVGGLQIDGDQITTGPELLDVADDGLVMFVITSIFGLMALTEGEGKGSASPSTSSPGAGPTAVSSLAATSTVNGSGTLPSTATATPAPVQSGAPGQ